MYMDGLKKRDFYVMNEREALAYLEHIHLVETDKHFDEDDDFEAAANDDVLMYGTMSGEIVPCNDDVFAYWHVIPYYECRAYSVERIRKGDLFIAESLIHPKHVFGDTWLRMHRHEFTYKFAD